MMGAGNERCQYCKASHNTICPSGAPWIRACAEKDKKIAELEADLFWENLKGSDEPEGTEEKIDYLRRIRRVERTALRGQYRAHLAALREALRRQWKREPLVNEWEGIGHFGKTGEYKRCTACGAEGRNPARNRRGPFKRIRLVHKPACSWLVCQNALAADAGKAVTEDEIEEAAATEIKKQLSDDAGKKEVG